MALLERHPLSALWGDMDEEAFDEFVEDVSAHGVRVPVVMYEGKVLEGWHRYRAALRLGITYPRKAYEGDDPGAFVISANAHRRHLTKLGLAERVLLVDEHRQATRPPSLGDDLARTARTNAELAVEAGTSVGTVKRARHKIREDRGEVPPTPPKPPAPKRLTRMERLTDENAHLQNKNTHLQDELDRYVNPPPEPSDLEAEVKVLRQRVQSLLAEAEKEQRLHAVARERLKQCMEARREG